MKLLSLLRQAQYENTKVILDMVEENPSARILDCGCGNGEFTKILAEKVGTTDVRAIEFVEEAAQLAEKNGIKVYRANLNEKLPIKDEEFDFVHANQVIEHLYETDVFIKETYRILKSGGYAIISTPNLGSLHNIVSLIFGKQPFGAHISNEVIVGTLFDLIYRKHANKGGIHMRIFTYGALKKLFEYHGFQIATIVGVGYYPLPRKAANVLARIDPLHAVYLAMKVKKP